MKKLLASLVLPLAATAAHAGGVYVAAGLPGAILGYAQPLSDRFALRVDVATIGEHQRRDNEHGIDYDARLKSDRLGLFADWFVVGGLRLTGGITAFDARLDMAGRGNGTITIGDTTYVTGPDDRFDVTVELPRTMPYLGIGYGHTPSGKGWGFTLDLGVSFGKPKVSGRASGPLLSNSVAQEDVERELDEIRDAMDRIKGVPQLTLGLTYRF